MKIYCDESGYTGADLLEAGQPYFVYCGVSTDKNTEKEILNFIYDNYPIQNNEIKGKLLVNNSKGRQVISHIFKKYSKHARIVFHDKKYALAAKIVEYGVEPYLSSNQLFYESQLNQFLATGLYASFISNDKSAESLFQEFLIIARGKKQFAKSDLHSMSKGNAIVDWVIAIINHNPNIFLKEIKTTSGSPEKWILDLTMTSLLGILTDWSKDGSALEVMCDNSKVFIDNPLVDTFNQMGLVGSKADFLGVKLGFNLVGDIKNGDSATNAGLQIADLFSSTVFYCLKNKGTDFSNEIMKLVLKNCTCKPASFCVMPYLKFDAKAFKKDKNYYFRLMQIIYIEILRRIPKR